MWLGHQFQGQKVKGQLVADVLNSQHAGTGATWRINAKILSTCSGRRHIVSPRALLVISADDENTNFIKCWIKSTSFRFVKITVH